MFYQVKLSYMVVGHTHDILDRIFSNISTVLKGKTIGSLQDLLYLLQTEIDVIKDANGKRVKVPVTAGITLQYTINMDLKSTNPVNIQRNNKIHKKV